MKIRDFAVETWMNRYETRCELNLAETCVDSLTVAELLAIAGRSAESFDELKAMKLTYGAIAGTKRLRGHIAALYERQAIGNVVVAHGAIGANALVYAALIEPGDRVVTALPTYQQHYSIPESYGANVQVLRLRAEHVFLPDLNELEALATPGTKLIVLSNPNNPTGALMDEAMLRDIVAIAKKCGAWLLCDEVYRGLDQRDSGRTTSIADLYERGISTGSMSKAYSLAGLRLGWIVAPTDLLDAVIVHRDYNTISVGMIDDYLASLALEHSEAILTRSRGIVRENLAHLDRFMAAQPRLSWVRPSSGTVALLKYDANVTSESLCLQLLDRTGVMLTPGSVMDMEGHLRIGYANANAILVKGLSRLNEFLETTLQ